MTAGGNRPNRIASPSTPTVFVNEPRTPAAADARSMLQRRNPTKTAHATTPINSRGRMATMGFRKTGLSAFKKRRCRR